MNTGTENTLKVIHNNIYIRISRLRGCDGKQLVGKVPLILSSLLHALLRIVDLRIGNERSVREPVGIVTFELLVRYFVR